LEKAYRKMTIKAKTYSKMYYITKRILDILFSLFLLIPILPFLLIMSVLIMIDSPGPPLYLQERLGLHGKIFKIIKLRSMKKDAEQQGIQWATINDARVTRIGRWMRKTRVDELPQLLNILLGDMSFVGPRPERPYFHEQFKQQYPLFIARLYVRPGLTGWAQVNGGYNLSPEEKLQYDLIYIKRMSLLFDMKILLQTIRIILTGDGAR